MTSREHKDLTYRAGEPLISRQRGSLRVLIQNRPNTFTQRGGDSVQVERLSQGLRARGCEVVVDLSASEDPSHYDIVHLFNFATTEYTEMLAKRAYAAGVPYVVTTLYEEVPNFHNQSHALAKYLIDYQRTGQDKGWWERTTLDLSTVDRAPRFQVDWIVEHASALLTNGSRETAAIRRDFPLARNLIDIPLGHEVGACVGPELFMREYGVRDFVLCVGRFETRKNQLMLLRALEDSNLTVVLASGGFSYQLDYDTAVRNFRRRGRTIIVERISPEMLSSAYAASRIHALPSWYELPGHVSLEAASHAKNIVVTDTGTQVDYFGSYGFYCQPWDIESIEGAVVNAINAPFPDKLLEVAKSYSWEHTIDKTLDVYSTIAQASAKNSAVVNVASRTEIQDSEDDMNHSTTLLLEQAEHAARLGDWSVAQRVVEEVSAQVPSSPRLLRLQGIIHLAASRFAEAASVFGKMLTKLSGEEDLVSAYRVALTQSQDEVAASSIVAKLLRTDISSGDLKPPPHDVFGQTNALTDTEKATRLAYLLKEAESTASEAEFPRAYELLEEALSLDPESARALRIKGTFLLAENKPEKAAKYFEASLGYEPKDSRALAGFGLSLIAQTNFRSAYPFLVRAAEEEPHHMLTLLGLIQCSYAIGRFDDLIQALTRHLVDSPRDKEMRYCLAAALFKQGRVADAEREVALVIQVDVNHRGANELFEAIVAEKRRLKESMHAEQAGNVNVVVELSELEALKRTQQYTTVLERCEKLLQLPLSDSSLRERILILKADSFALSGDEEDARAMYSEVLQVNPQSSRALSGQGALAAYRSSWESAEQLFLQARELDERNDSAWAGLGLCHRERAEWESAWRNFSRALELNSVNAGALYGAIDVGYQLERLPEVEELILSYLSHEPEDLEVRYALGECLIAQGKIERAEQCLSDIGAAEPAGDRFRQLGVRIAESRVRGDSQR